ncbi:hypothetical protein AC73_3737 [Escherichia coli 2-427-07_S4_C1]|nr:hypothetical protein CSC06_0579 [Escherichia coli]KDY40845.1 hypothetical protein AC73_3737 [Escherichia coli 2-427-07_S4_C1]
MIISRPRSPTLKNHLNITHQLTPQNSDQNANYKQKSTKQY